MASEGRVYVVNPANLKLQVSHSSKDNWSLFGREEPGGSKSSEWLFVPFNETSYRIQTPTHGRFMGGESSLVGNKKADAKGLEWEISETTATVGVSAALFATFVPSVAVATTEELTAYTVKVGDNRLDLTALPAGTVIPSGSAVVVGAAAAGEFHLPVMAGAEALADNDLLATAEPLVATGTQYILGKSSTSGKVGFGKVTVGTVIPAGKGYLELTPAQASKVQFFSIDGSDDQTTAIESAEADSAEKVFYNLQGMRVAQPEKGVYILNGNKVIIK